MSSRNVLLSDDSDTLVVIFFSSQSSEREARSVLISLVRCSRLFVAFLSDALPASLSTGIHLLQA